MFRRHVCVRQNDQSDCGAAALATLSLYHGRSIGLEQLRDLTGTDRVGTSLQGLLRAAERLGFSARGVHGAYEGLVGVPFPCVAHVKNADGTGHFVVLYRATDREVLVADPADGTVEKRSRELFCQQWTGYLLLATPDQLHAARQVEQGNTKPWRRLCSLLRGHTSLLLEAFFCAILMTILGVASSYFVQHLVDSVLVRSEGQLLNALGIGMVCILVFKCLFAIIRQYLLAYVGQKVDLVLMAGYARHLLRLPLPFFEMRRVGDILSRLHDAEKVRDAISGTTLTAVVDGTLVIVSLVFLWAYDVPLALVATAFAPLLVASVALHHPMAKRRSRQAMEEGARLSSHLVENVSGVETIKAFAADQPRLHEAESYLVRFLRTTFSLQKLGLSMSTLGTIVTGLASLVVLWYGGHRVMQGALTIGELMFFSSLLGYLLDPLERLATVNLSLQEALIAVDRLYQVLDLKAEQEGSEPKVAFTGLRDAVVLDHVTFRYSHRGNVLEDVSLKIPVGKTVAIVGESGSGKSTLLKLLMGFYHATEGRVLFDGADVRDVDVTSLRRRIGYVSQDPFIFNGSLRENMALGRPDAPLAEIIEAARLAGLEGFIAGLPERFETMIGERGVNLSGGQRQRLAIARALVQQPDLLIFDEATSHLDTATELSIQNSLRQALAGKTVVLVAHRLSTIKAADYTYVLRDGRVSQEGTHRDLLARLGLYSRLWQIQTAGPGGRGLLDNSPAAQEIHAGQVIGGEEDHHA